MGPRNAEIETAWQLSNWSSEYQENCNLVLLLSKHGNVEQKIKLNLVSLMTLKSLRFYQFFVWKKEGVLQKWLLVACRPLCRNSVFSFQWLQHMLESKLCFWDCENSSNLLLILLSSVQVLGLLLLLFSRRSSLWSRFNRIASKRSVFSQNFILKSVVDVWSVASLPSRSFTNSCIWSFFSLKHKGLTFLSFSLFLIVTHWTRQRFNWAK